MATTSSGPPPGPCQGIANDCCATAIDVTGGGTFTGTTCGADTTFTSTGMCGPVGSPDAFYRFSSVGSPGYHINVSNGFYVMITNHGADCTKPSGCLLPADMGVINGDGDPRWIAVQRSDGGCGAFALVITQMN